MVPADVTTPEEVHEELTTETALPTRAVLHIDQQTRSRLREFDEFQADLLVAAFTAEITSLGYAIRQGDFDQVVARSAEVVECISAQIAVSMPNVERGRLEVIARYNAQHLRAASTQMALYTDAEASSAVQETLASVTSVVSPSTGDQPPAGRLRQPQRKRMQENHREEARGKY
ncbi:hypothetical protein PHYSODRAFT_526914 [Phytophthora sojae]|uniref:Uncharacterized protein n=1 Tax=Phytophthora sojae (strain P6497) TaxID=1094619 RepID=G5A8H3_PHYSP|nr:hypothetical protein PHYSODRAFT_526914 [Phytophthora sojae]EGZ08199.1 hypothetical protein PHYSODRAFT_526914 [Phytophthora sojae]|eukprot:XP_009536371.1 hypothetical protein PHYSODRAFT_526914 [Phytophthora sojae]